MMADGHKRPGLLRRIRAVIYLWSGRVHRHYGIVHGDREEFMSAVESYGRAVELDPFLGKAYLERGILLWRELGRASHAVRDLTAALNLHPGWPDALFNRGQAYQTAGNYRAAFADLSAYLSLGKGSWRENAANQLEHLRAIVEAQPDDDEQHGS